MQQPSSANIEQLSTYKIPGSINEQSNPPKYESSSSSSFSTTISFQQRTSEDHPQVVNSSSPNTGDLRSTASDSQQTVSPSHDIDKILSDGSRTMCPTPQINDEVNSTSDQDTVFNGRISPEVVHSMDSNMGVTSGADNISIVHFPRSFVDSDLYDAYTPKSPIASDNESTDLIRNRKRPAGYDFEIDENKVERSLDDRDGLVQSTYHNQLRSGVPLDYALCETVPLDVVLSDQEV